MYRRALARDRAGARRRDTDLRRREAAGLAILGPMVSRRWSALAALSCACSVTAAPPPQPLAEPAVQATAVAPAPAAELAAPAPAAVVEKPREPGFCDQVPEGMVCEPGGKVEGTDVELSPFYIDARPVSVGEYAACHAAGACTRRPSQRGVAQDAPAVVDWLRAREVCAWHGKRLPSEWEWQQGARGRETLALEWTGTAGAKDCGAACSGRDPLGPCDGVHPCGGARVLRGHQARVVESLHQTRRSPGVRCASGAAALTTWPPRQVAEPYPEPPVPGPLSEAARRLVAEIDQDPIEDKKICDEEVRATWAPGLQRGGRAALTCRDPFPYIKANEGRTHVFAPFIANLGGAYVGVASDQNYSLLAAARSEIAWLVDYDPRVVVHHKRLRALILRSDTPQAFVARFAPEGQREALAIFDEVYAGDPDLAAIKAGFRATREDLALYYAGQLKPAARDAGEFGWLADAEDYAYVRALYQQGRIVPVKGDLMGARTLRSIAAAANALAVPVRVVYLSNAPTAWGGDVVQGFRDNLRGLPFDERSVVLQTTNAGGFRQTGYWHYNIADGRHLQRLLARPGYDRVMKLLAERIPTPDGDVTVLALPGAGPRAGTAAAAK